MRRAVAIGTFLAFALGIVILVGGHQRVERTEQE